MEQQKYGLFKFSKNPSSTKNNDIIKRSSAVFNESSDSDDDTNNVNINYHQSSNLKRQTQTNIQKAIEIDPTIFQYDEIYDDINNKKSDNDNKIITNERKKPKYINNLLKMAENRKIENEIRLERKIQKERENEGDEFNDKESFVTSSYRGKLEQMRKIHEEMEKQDNLEKLLDVTKHDNLNGFYRSLYKNNIFNNDNDDNKNSNNNNEKIIFNKTNNRNKKTIREINVNDDCDVDDNVNNEGKKLNEKQQQQENVNKKQQETANEKVEDKKNYENSIKSSDNKSDIIDNDKDKNKQSSETIINQQTIDQSSPLPAKPKLSRTELIEKLFTKRTIGDVYEQAKQRYFERQKQRLLKI